MENFLYTSKKGEIKMQKITKTQHYLELLRDKLAKTENKRIYDRRIYELLDMPSQTFSKYINGQRTMPDHVAIKVADYLHLERLEVIAEIHKENAESEEEKKTWSEAQKLIASGFAGVALTSTLSLAPEPVKADSSKAPVSHSIYYTNTC